MYSPKQPRWIGEAVDHDGVLSKGKECAKCTFVHKQSQWASQATQSTDVCRASSKVYIMHRKQPNQYVKTNQCVPQLNDLEACIYVQPLRSPGGPASKQSSRI